MTAEPPGLRSGVRRGLGWGTLDVALSRLGNFVLGLVLARLLVPADFGVFAVALIVHSVLVNVSDLGVGSALIRESGERVDRMAPTVVTIAMVSALVLALLMVLSAPLVASTLDAPRSASAIRVMALNLPLAGLAAVPTALLRRTFRLDRLFVADMGNLAATCGLAIPLALAGGGPLTLAWSWVAGQVATSAIVCGFEWRRCRPGFVNAHARDLLRFGLPLGAANVAGFATQNADYVVVGRALGSAQLGFYMLAFNISGWPLNVFSAVIRGISLPALARLQEDREELAHRFAEGLRLIGAIALPGCALLSALAGPLVVALYGSRWRSAASALIGLAIFSAVRTLIEPFQDYLVVRGRTSALLIVQVCWLVLLSGALILAVPSQGIAGAGFVQAVVAAGFVLPLYALFLRHLGLPVAPLVRSIGIPALWSVLVGLSAWVIGRLLAGPWVQLIVGASAGSIVWMIGSRRELRSVWKLAWHKGEPMSPGISFPSQLKESYGV